MTESNAVSARTVLVAEDDDEIGEILEFMIAREGFKVLRAHDGREAIRLIEESDAPDLIVLDIMLPYHDGFELIAKVRARAGWESIPVVMLTARSQENDIARALEAGANDYVVKPFQPQELIARMRRLLKR